MPAVVEGAKFAGFDVTQNSLELTCFLFLFVSRAPQIPATNRARDPARLQRHERRGRRRTLHVSTGVAVAMLACRSSACTLTKR